jgi:hypothetical protein
LRSKFHFTRSLGYLIIKERFSAPCLNGSGQKKNAPTKAGALKIYLERRSYRRKLPLTEFINITGFIFHFRDFPPFPGGNIDITTNS